MPFRNASIHYLNHRIIVPIALTIAIAVLVLYLEPSQKATNWLLQQTQSEEGIKSLEPPPSSKFYEWQTRSQFRPISKDEAANASAQELCEYFPKHLLRDIQPVLKTGHGVLEDRVGPQLNGVSACLDNLLIFSDLEEDFMGHHIIDVIADIPLNYTIEPYEPKAAKDLAVYHAMQSLHTNGTLAEANFTAKEQWLLDRFKFLTGASRAWKMRPERRWYIFYEADTYIVWDNVFRLLEQFDPDIPWYFGAPSPGRKIGENNEITTWFANGGPGYVLSRETMRRLVSDDWDAKTGEYQGSKLIESNWDEIVKNCCGDSALSWILWQKDIKLSGLWPMFGGAPHYVPFTEMFWCKPVLTMHRPTAEEVTDLWRWQWKHRQMDMPLLWRDLAVAYFNITSLTRRDDWDIGRRQSFPPPIPSEHYSDDPHESPEACQSACEALPKCLQWRYHLQKCTFADNMKAGLPRKPEVGKEATNEEKDAEWDAEDLRFISGWISDKIQRRVNERPCNAVEWVRPSIERVA